MIFFGASGHAKVVIEAWLASGGKVTRIYDDDGSIKRLLSYDVRNDYVVSDFLGRDICISIGSNTSRKKIATKLEARFKSVVHPAAIISNSSVIGNGTVMMAKAIVNADSKIGHHVILNTGVIVEHDCLVDDFAHISPHATLCGGVYVGEGTHVGAGATVIQNIKIGKWAIIGAGSVVLKDVPDFEVVAGVPAKIIRTIKG